MIQSSDQDIKRKGFKLSSIRKETERRKKETERKKKKTERRERVLNFFHGRGNNR